MHIRLIRPPSYTAQPPATLLSALVTSLIALLVRVARMYDPRIGSNQYMSGIVRVGPGDCPEYSAPRKEIVSANHGAF